MHCNLVTKQHLFNAKLFQPFEICYFLEIICLEMILFHKYKETSHEAQCGSISLTSTRWGTDTVALKDTGGEKHNTPANTGWLWIWMVSSVWNYTHPIQRKGTPVQLILDQCENWYDIKIYGCFTWL